MSKKIGLFFGIFNPIHNGHIKIGKIIIEKLKFDEIWYIVTPCYNIKPKKNLIDFNERIKLIDIATKKYSNLISKDFEINLSYPYYTIDTLSFLKKFNYFFSIIMGEDNLYNITKWKKYKKILQDYNIISFPRKTTYKSSFYKNKSILRLDKIKPINISSSYIVKNFNNYIMIKNMIDPNVYSYIKEKELLNR